MPKIKKTPQQVKTSILLACVKKYMVINDITTQEVLAKKLGISQPTLSIRLKNPGTFTLNEVHSLFSVLKVSEYDKTEIYRELCS